MLSPGLSSNTQPVLSLSGRTDRDFGPFFKVHHRTTAEPNRTSVQNPV